MCFWNFNKKWEKFLTDTWIFFSLSHDGVCRLISKKGRQQKHFKSFTTEPRPKGLKKSENQGLKKFFSNKPRLVSSSLEIVFPTLTFEARFLCTFSTQTQIWTRKSSFSSGNQWAVSGKIPSILNFRPPSLSDSGFQAYSWCWWASWSSTAKMTCKRHSVLGRSRIAMLFVRLQGRKWFSPFCLLPKSL